MWQDNPETTGPTGRRSPKPAARRTFIEQALRQRIVKGEYRPGTRLPVRVELERQFEASPVTVQRALDRLIEEGFVQTRGRGGTYVVEHPPHLACYGLIFPQQPGHRDWNRFWTALSNESRRLEQAGPRRTRIYHGTEARPDSEEFKMLLVDMQRDRLAGLIFAFFPGFLQGTPLLTMPGIPRVVACEQEWPGTSIVTFDSHGLIDKSLDYFVSQGRRRVAILSLHGFAQANERYIAAGLKARGLISRPYWLQSLTHSSPKAVQNCAHLLMNVNQTERPDGLLIADDNLIEPATTGLVAAGVKGPEDLEIVGHCNFPWPTPSHLPLIRIGYDITHFLQCCIQSIDRQRDGQLQPTITQVTPSFGNETTRA